MQSEFDVVIIGGGAVAENVADRAVQGGLTVALIESELVGGECSYWACMPSKALIRSGLALRAAQRVGGAREAVTGQLDVAAVFARRNTIVHDWNDESQVDWAESTGIAVVRGHGRLTGPKQVTVTARDGTTQVLTAEQAVVVSTGSDPLLPARRYERPGGAEAAGHHRRWRRRCGDGDGVREFRHRRDDLRAQRPAAGAGGFRRRDGERGASRSWR